MRRVIPPVAFDYVSICLFILHRCLLKNTIALLKAYQTERRAIRSVEF